MNKEEIYYLLSRLNNKLKSIEEIGEIHIYGGAVMCLCLNAREQTKDIDAIFSPKNKIYEFIEEIAEEESIRTDWLNDGIKGFLSANNNVYLLENMSNLKIYAANPEYLLAMKVLSARTEEDQHDMYDIKFLIDKLKLKNPDEVIDIVLKYFSGNMLKPMTYWMLTEMFDTKS